MKDKLIRVFAIIALVLLVAAPQVAAFTQNDVDCTQNSTCFYDPSASGNQCATASAASSDTTDTTGGDSSSASLPAGTTPAQKIAQTFMVGFDVGTPQSVIQDIVSKYHIGGIYFTGGQPGSAAAAGLNKQFFDSLSQAAGTPVTVASDEEGGEVYRFDYSDISGGFPSAKQMGSMSDSQVEQIGKEVSSDMTSNGVTIDLAPVLDLDDGTNIISQGDRSFSSDANTVAEKAGAFAQGLEDGGVTPIFKHFPGFGGAGSGNTDTEPVTTPSSYNLQQNLIPYKTLLSESQNSGAGVMLSNIYVSGLTDGLPASVSPKAVDYLRNTLNFSGLITTDDLSALGGYGGQAIDLPTAVVDALKAGVDMPLFGLGTSKNSTNASAEATMQSVINAVSGGVPGDTINDALNQVMSFKSSNPSNTSTSTSAGGCCSVDTATTLSGNEPEQQIFNYFVAKGLTPIQAAAIDGNFGQESGWNSSESGGYLAQWGGDRLTALEAYAQQQNKPVTDLGLQLDYVWLELTDGPGAGADESPVLQNLKGTSDIVNATTVFMGTASVGGNISGYENPGNPQLQNRITYAQEALAEYGGSASGNGTLASTLTGGGCSGITASGQDTQYINNFVVYNQCDPAWATKPYGDTTICDAGCGPSSMAMIITNLTGQSVTPDIAAAYADSQGLYVDGEGSSWSIGPVLAQHWGLKAVPLSADVSSITTALQSGALVIAPGNGPLPYTGDGHFIVIRGVTADGKWEIGDPGHSNTSSQEWDPQQLVASMIANGGGGIYAISK